jgi:hypothetical protein
MPQPFPTNSLTSCANSHNRKADCRQETPERQAYSLDVLILLPEIQILS